ncbi:hypothetical protein [Sphingobacterium multivorum]
MFEEDLDLPPLFVNIYYQGGFPLGVVGQKVVLVACGAVPKVNQA